MRTRWFAIPILLTMLLAGCAADAPRSEAKAITSSAPPATASLDTGAISGLTLNDEALPLAGARIGISPGTAEITSDAEGRFSFSELAPGTYALVVERVGYESTGRKAEVRAGEVTYVNLTLKPIVIAEPYVEPLIFNGYIRYGNALVDILTSTFEIPGCEKCVFKFKINETVQSVVFEVTFKPTLPPPVTATLYTQTYGGGAVGGPVYINKDLADREKVQVDKKWKDVENIHQLLFCGRESVCLEQRYTEYVSMFHHSMPPETFTALPPP
jgi:hypothetical protein